MFNKVFFLHAATMDAEWNLQPLAKTAFKIWKQHRVEVEGLFEHVTLDEWEEILEHFMQKGMKLWDIDARTAKLLFDACQWKDNIENGRCLPPGERPRLTIHKGG